MIKSRFAGLFIIPALLFTINTSEAAVNTAQQTLRSTLGAYLDIQAVSEGSTLKTTIAPDTGNLAEQLVAKFNINVNNDNQIVYLQGITNSNAGSVNSMVKILSTVYMVFSNTTPGKLPSIAAINEAKAAVQTPASNPNVITYSFNLSLTGSKVPTYDTVKNQYSMNVSAGTTTATGLTGTIPYGNTYSLNDSAGTYQSIVTLTSTSL